MPNDLHFEKILRLWLRMTGGFISPLFFYTHDAILLHLSGMMWNKEEGHSMKKTLCALLALILICGAVGCGAGEQSSGQQAEPGSVTETEPTEKPETEEPFAGQPFVLSEHLDTIWYSRYVGIDEEPYFFQESLSVYEDGEAALTHDRVDYRLKDNGGTFLLEKDLYASPFETEPCLTLAAGEIRLLTDGETVRFEVVSDPLGIFDGFDPQNAVLTQQMYFGKPWKPYKKQDTPREFGTDPQFQPQTEWVEGGPHLEENGGLDYYVNCALKTEADGTVKGYIRRAPEAENEDCVLLWAPDAAALVRPDDAELLFYGGVTGDRDWYETGDCRTYGIKACYDPYALKVGNKLLLKKKGMSLNPEPEYVLGYGQYEIEARFTENGWTSEPLSMKWDEDYDDEDYGELFLKLTKDGRMLLIYLDGIYAYVYVLLDADGRLESWGGCKPLDHTVADACVQTKEFPDAFSEIGLWGLWEDDRVLLLDDGRILVTYLHHETWSVLASVIFDPRNP